jgi:hypothetical protein
MTLPTPLPSLIPPGGAPVLPGSGPVAGPANSIYDISIGGIEFVMSNTGENPLVRETVPVEKPRVDQAATPGENTLTSWWIKSQDSFHGGAGQLNLEPAFPTDVDHIRYDLSKNADVFTPGRVMRLPDTTVISTDNCVSLAPVTSGGVDRLAYLTAAPGTVRILSNLTGTPTVAAFTAVSNIRSIATDGVSVYAVDDLHVYKLDPGSLGSSVTLATLPATATTPPVLGWVKARLMLGVDGSIYELDVTATSVTLGASQLRYKHPTAGWAWRCFSTGPSSILAAGDAFGVSTITQFTLDQVAGAPVLTVAGEACTLPIGERVLSLASSQGTVLAIGTSKGIRIGSYNTYTGALTYGPLELTAAAPTIPCTALATRDRFVFGAGLAYDEGGLLRVDLGTKIDQAGRYAWAPDLIAPVSTLTPANAVVTLNVLGRLVFSIPGTGILLEGAAPGSGRESWIRTSRIRFGTTEPKLFKLGRLRGSFISGDVGVTAQNPSSTTGLINVGFTETDPDEFRLPPGKAEWLALTFNIVGPTTVVSNYSVKALPGTRKQRHLQFVLAVASSETTRSGQRTKDALSARDKLAQLEELDASGDETILQEYTPLGVVSTRVIVERVTFTQTGRPGRRSDLGGNVTVILRTVES